MPHGLTAVSSSACGRLSHHFYFLVPCQATESPLQVRAAWPLLTVVSGSECNSNVCLVKKVLRVSPFNFAF